MEHGVAVITNVGQRTSAESHVRLPTGELSLLVWSPASRKFTQSVRTDFGGERDFVLLPPCCGRGAACPQLALTMPDERRWPNGEELNVREINSISQAFLTFTQDALPSHKLVEHLKPFKRLLGSLMPSAVSAAAEPATSKLEDESCEEGEKSHESPMDGAGEDSDGSFGICEDGPDQGDTCQGCGAPPGGRGCSWCYED